MTLTNLLFSGSRDAVLDYMETTIVNANVGTGSTAPSAADTALATQVFEDVIDSIDTTAVDRRVFTLEIGSGEANGNTIREGGFELSSGNLAGRWLLNSILKTSDIQLWLDATIIVTVTEVP